MLGYALQLALVSYKILINRVRQAWVKLIVFNESTWDADEREDFRKTPSISCSENMYAIIFFPVNNSPVYIKPTTQIAVAHDCIFLLILRPCNVETSQTNPYLSL